MEGYILLPLKCPINFSLNLLGTGCLYLLTGYNDEYFFHACALFGLPSGFKLNGNSGFNSYLTLSASFEGCLNLKILFFLIFLQSLKPWVNAPSLFISFNTFFFTSILLSSVCLWSVCLLISGYFAMFLIYIFIRNMVAKIV